MDYEKIYASFIKDRTRKAPPVGYSENHHILPRSLGGSDDPDNLILLTPEDHFFAHLLLAKIHGGKMWSPIAFMVGGSRKDYRPIESRRSYGWAVRALSKSKMREGAYNFDDSIHAIVNIDGRKWAGRQIDMIEVGINRASACRLVNGKQRVTHNGWYVDNGQAIPRRGKLHSRAKNDVFRFVSAKGEKFRGTRIEFHAHSGIAKSMITRLVTGEFICAKGWTIEGRTPPTTGRGASAWR